MTPEDLLLQLSKLLPGQFELVVSLARIPHEYLSGSAAPQAARAVEVMRYVEQQGELEQLAEIVARITTRGGSAVDLSPYVAEVKRAWTEGAAASRMLVNATESVIEVALSGSTLRLEGSHVYQIVGAGGRGKTSLLRILALHALANPGGAGPDPGRVPICVRATDAGGDILVAASRQFMSIPALAPQATFRDWLARTPALVLIDDWHLLHGAELETAELSLRQLLGGPCCVVIAGRPGMRPLRQSTSILTLGPLGAAEQRNFVSAYLPDAAIASHVMDWISMYASRDMARLLAEPVVLRELLRLVATEPGGSWKRSRTVPALLDSVIVSMCESRSSRPEELRAEIEAVCLQLSSRQRFDLADVNAQTVRNGISRTAAEFASELVDAGVWSHERTRASSYRFSHDLWRYHFQCKAAVVSLVSAADIERWVADAEDLELQVIFMAGLLGDPEAQAALFDALLKRSVELYALALQARGSWDETSGDHERHVLLELRAGYLEFIRECCPGMQRYLPPWEGAQGREDLKLVVLGRSWGNIISYTLALAKPTEPDVSVTDVHAMAEDDDARWQGTVLTRGRDLDMSGTRRDSARLIAMDEALRGLRALTGQWVLPMSEMVARERARAACAALLRRGFFPSHTEAMTVWQLGEWAEGQRGKGLVVGSWSGDSHRDIIDADELVEICARLGEHGLGATRVMDLGMVRHSLRELVAQPAPPVSAIQDWLCDFFTAVIATYRITIEQGYPGLRDVALLGQFPCRLVAHLQVTAGEQISGGDRFSVIHWWEAVATWEEAVSTVFLGAPEPAISADGSPLFDELERKASALGRTRMRAALSDRTLASLERSDTPVIDFVCVMVGKDLESFHESISGAD